MLANEKKNKKMGNLMNLEFLLDMDDSIQPQKNPFGNMDYELMDMDKNYDRNQENKMYGDRSSNLFWAPLD